MKIYKKRKRNNQTKKDNRRKHARNVPDWLFEKIKKMAQEGRGFQYIRQDLQKNYRNFRVPDRTIHAAIGSTKKP